MRNPELGFQVPLDPGDQTAQESASGRAFLTGPVGTASRGGPQSRGLTPPRPPGAESQGEQGSPRTTRRGPRAKLPDGGTVGRRGAWGGTMATSPAVGQECPQRAVSRAPRRVLWRERWVGASRAPEGGRLQDMTWPGLPEGNTHHPAFEFVPWSRRAKYHELGPQSDRTIFSHSPGSAGSGHRQGRAPS